MQGINKGKHERLMDALLLFKRLLDTKQPECNCLQQTTAYRRELETMQNNYSRLLDVPALQITAYEELYSEVKIHFLAKKLKELKKEIPADSIAAIPALTMLRENIQLAYGT